MKKTLHKKTFWQSILTIGVLAVFAIIAMATFPGTSIQKRELTDGRWEIAKYYSNGKKEFQIGNVDSRGNFIGPVRINYEDDYGQFTHHEEVNMVDGERHGLSTTYWPDRTTTQCYQHGHPVDSKYCNKKSASIQEEDNSAYQVFNTEFPWYAFKLDAFGFDSVYVRAYLDTLESVLYSVPFSEEEFDDNYGSTVFMLEYTHWDSLIQLNDELSIYHGLDMIQRHEFRLATQDSYIGGSDNTYNVIKSGYQNYFLELLSYGITDADFEGFCTQYDAIMSGYEPMEPDNPYYLDSLDARMYRAMDSIYYSEENFLVELKSGNSELFKNPLKSYRILAEKKISEYRKQVLDYTPKQVAQLVLLTIAEDLLKGDLIGSAVKKAYYLQNGIISPPTVVTDFTGSSSPTSASISGIVISDGGGEIITRGIAWGTGHNPTTANHVESAGSGTEDFEATMTGLVEGEKYHARAFAANSVGISYGNNVEFVAANTTGIYRENMNSIELNLYPNPASNFVNISFNTENSVGIVFSIFDISGKQVVREELDGIKAGENTIQLDVFKLASGVYSCRIEDRNNILGIQKLIINR